MTTETQTAAAAPAAAPETPAAPATPPAATAPAPSPAPSPAPADAANPAAAGDIDAELRGANDAETIANLTRRMNGLREKLSQQGAVPESPDAYAFTLDGELAPYSEHLAKDPVFAGMKSALHKAGLTDKQFGTAVTEVMKMLQETGNLQPYDPDAERKLLFPAITDPAQRQQEVQKAHTEARATLEAMKASMPAHAYTVAQEMLDRAGGIQLVQFMQTLGRQQPPMTTGTVPAGAITEQSLQARMADARNKIDSSSYDHAFATETARQYQQFYGDQPKSA